MERDLGALPPALLEALVDTMCDNFAAQVYVTLTERPGVAISDIASRLDASPRRVRHQIGRMVEAGLAVVESETPRGNARRRNYRAVALARILGDMDESFDDDRRRKIAGSILRLITADLGRSLRDGTFGTRPGHAEVRLAAELDEQGWLEISDIVARATAEMERAATEGAERLATAGETGIEATAALLLFEALPWEEPEGDRHGPRRSVWTPEEQAGLSPVPGCDTPEDRGTDEGPAAPKPTRPQSEADLAGLPPGLRDELIEVLSDPLRARIYATLTERPGITISQIAARTGDPERSVRHQIDRMLAAGLVEVEGVTPRGNARQRHYRAISVGTIYAELDESFDEERRRRIAGSAVRLITDDIARALRHGTLGARAGHAEVRIPASVDEDGWRRLSGIIERATGEAEGVAVRSAARLVAAGEPGIEAVAAFLLVESSLWDPGQGGDDGPRRTMWSPGEIVGVDAGGSPPRAV